MTPAPPCLSPVDRHNGRRCQSCHPLSIHTLSKSLTEIPSQNAMWWGEAGMSEHYFFTFGIGNGKWPSLFLIFGIWNGNTNYNPPNFGIWNGNEKSNSQLLVLGRGMKTLEKGCIETTLFPKIFPIYFLEIWEREWE